MSMHKGIIGQSEGGATVSERKEDTTLGDYIQRKLRQDAFDSVANEKKLTFDEWYSQSGWPALHTQLSLDDADSCKYIMHQAWKAAQENV